MSTERGATGSITSCPAKRRKREAVAEADRGTERCGRRRQNDVQDR